MTFDAFKLSLAESEKPDRSLPLPLQGLWWEAKNDWGKAHDLCQKAMSQDGDWVHAYLHRTEGDLGNAAYWYSRAGKETASGDLREEWARIVAALLRCDGC